MPIANRGSFRIHYDLTGRPGQDVLVLINSLGSDLHMWDKVLSLLEAHYRVLRYDVRGHGLSGASSGPLTISDLGEDLLFLTNQLGIEPVHLCGISLGGLIAMWAGIHAAERVNRIVLANTAARIGTPEAWEQRRNSVLNSGLAPLVETAPGRWFTQAYQEQHPAEMQLIREMVARTDAASYAACCGVLRDTDLRAGIGAIEAPCLIIAGTYDAATPPSHGRALQAGLRSSRYLQIDCSHLSAWEGSEQFSQAAHSFLSEGECGNG